MIENEHFKLKWLFNFFIIVVLFSGLFHKSFLPSVLSSFCGKIQFKWINSFWQKKTPFHRKMSVYFTFSLKILYFICSDDLYCFSIYNEAFP